MESTTVHRSGLVQGQDIEAAIDGSDRNGVVNSDRVAVERVKSHPVFHVVPSVLPTSARILQADSATVTIIAGLLYCSASVTMVLVNKMALSTFNFKCPTGLLFFQCFLSAVLVWAFSLFHVVPRQKLNWPIVQHWLPVNLIFVGMLWTSFHALQHLSVPMVTVLKNLSNLFTILGDMWFYNRRYTVGVWLTLVLMTVSALFGMKTDLEFNWTGYFWQMLNCILTASYSLYLRGVMDRVAAHTEDKGPLQEISMVFLNNSLSLPFLLVLLAINGELTQLPAEPALHNFKFLVAALISGIVSFGISFASLWFLSASTPTIYSLVGSLNKVPIAIIALFLFTDRNANNPQNLASVALGLLAGVVFVKAKTGLQKSKNQQKPSPPNKGISQT